MKTSLPKYRHVCPKQVFKVVFRHAGALHVAHVFTDRAANAISFIELKFHGCEIISCKIGDPWEYDGTFIYTPYDDQFSTRLCRFVKPEDSDEK